MTSYVWRIATDTQDYEADDVTGAGAKKTGGRWNEKDVPVIYTSISQALACLETIVHLSSGGLPLNRYLVQISIPDDVWAACEKQNQSLLPVGWDARPAGRASIKFGTDWLRSGRTLLLSLPSVIVPDEYNILINPSHPDAKKISAKKIKRWDYDPRILRPI